MINHLVSTNQWPFLKFCDEEFKNNSLLKNTSFWLILSAQVTFKCWLLVSRWEFEIFLFFMKDWFQFPQGLTKEDFKASYTDQACSVCEYTYVSPSDSSRCNTTDLTGDTDDCSVTIAENESEEPSSPADSSYVLPEEEQQVMV